jgi:hypothetical protein
MLQTIKEKLRTLTDDDLDVKIGARVQRATAEELTSPAWELNMHIVDMVNQSPV